MTCADCAFCARCDAALRLQALLDATRYLGRESDDDVALRVLWAHACRAPQKRNRVTEGEP